MNNLLQGLRLDAFWVIEKGTSQFNEIKRELNVESNELSYHLKKLRMVQ
mgnify:CR=1 FL=1